MTQFGRAACGAYVDSTRGEDDLLARVGNLPASCTVSLTELDPGGDVGDAAAVLEENLGDLGREFASGDELA